MLIPGDAAILSIPDGTNSGTIPVVLNVVGGSVVLLLANSNILVYLEEGTMENDNYIEVLGVDKCRIYPLRGDFVWLNQQPQFEHRANNGEGIRRVIHFPYYIPSLDNKDKKW